MDHSQRGARGLGVGVLSKLFEELRPGAALTLNCIL
jgi:hypothetical protein